MLDTEVTKVCFIDFNGEVTAIFPELYDHHFITCYAHIGQHSACCQSLLWDYEHLTMENSEVRHLFGELTSIGYTLKLITEVEAKAI